MSAETDFRAALIGFGPLAALVGDRVAMHAIREDAALPYVVFNSRHDPQYTLNNTLVADFVTFEAQCWGQTATQAQEVADQVSAAVAAAGAIVTSKAGAYDPEMGLDAVQVSVEWLD